MKKILVFTATFNEIENIKSFLDKITTIKENFDVLIVDDNSPDKTWSVIEKYNSQNSKKINLIKRKKKEGLNTAHKLGFNYAKENNYDLLITLDADLSHDPMLISEFIKKCKDSENINGAISSNFFELILNRKYKFNSGPFLNAVFKLVEIRKRKLKVLIGNKVTTINKDILVRPV